MLCVNSNMFNSRGEVGKMRKSGGNSYATVLRFQFAKNHNHKPPLIAASRSVAGVSRLMPGFQRYVSVHHYPFP